MYLEKQYVFIQAVTHRQTETVYVYILIDQHTICSFYLFVEIVSVSFSVLLSPINLYLVYTVLLSGQSRDVHPIMARTMKTTKGIIFRILFLFYLIIVTVWVLAADKVAQESGKEQLATQNHRYKSNEEVR